MPTEQNRTNPNSSPARWFAASLRSVFLLRPQLSGLRAGPLLLLVLVAWLVLQGLVLQRIGVGGPARFYWQAVASGWLGTLLMLWACGLTASSEPSEYEPPTAASLFAVMLMQQIWIGLPMWSLYLLLSLKAQTSQAGAWALWALPFVVVGWTALAAIVLLLRHASGAARRAVVALTVLVAAASDLYAPPTQFWYPDMTAARDEEAEAPRLRLTQEVAESQSGALIAALNAMQPQRPGVADVYAITFSPYATEEVFRRESRMVLDVMRSRFDAQGRTVQLINHAATATELPWATGLNLQRAIQRAASQMDVNEDVLFIHLTSHGAKDGKLAADFAPLDVADITPTQLRAWLDEAGVRHRVVSISACYSGSWLQALAEPGTLVMTAADAEHTSYGCGRKSELTFFGRAMYDEQLRKTRSFEIAHAAARQVIEQREKDAGKTDGYSNPQIAMGAAIKPVLAALAKRLDAIAP